MNETNEKKTINFTPSSSLATLKIPFLKQLSIFDKFQIILHMIFLIIVRQPLLTLCVYAKILEQDNFVTSIQ